MSAVDKAIEILGMTRDGEDLAPQDLKLVELTVNNWCNEPGMRAFETLHSRVTTGTYTKPWHCEEEHVTKDHQGYVYWKGIEVEHFTFHHAEEEHAATRCLARRCQFLEAHGVEVSCKNVVWSFSEICHMHGTTAEEVDHG